MNLRAFRRSALQATLAVSLAASLLLTGCSDSTNTNVPGELEVAVSSGYPILGATVTLKGSNGASLQVVDTAKTGSVKIPRVEALGVLGFGPYLVQSVGAQRMAYRSRSSISPSQAVMQGAPMSRPSPI